MSAGLTDLTAARDEVLGCRSMGHAWDHTHDSDLVWRGGEPVAATRHERCLRCGSMRTRELDLRTFALTRTRVSYAEGYLAARGVRFARADVRAEEFWRLHRSVETRAS